MGLMNIYPNEYNLDNWIYDLFLKYILSINEIQDVETDITNKIYKEILCLPSGIHINYSDIRNICKIINKFS